MLFGRLGLGPHPCPPGFSLCPSSEGESRSRSALESLSSLPSSQRHPGPPLSLSSWEVRSGPGFKLVPHCCLSPAVTKTLWAKPPGTEVHVLLTATPQADFTSCILLPSSPMVLLAQASTLYSSWDTQSNSSHPSPSPNIPEKGSLLIVTLPFLYPSVAPHSSLDEDPVLLVAHKVLF